MQSSFDRDLILDRRSLLFPQSEEASPVSKPQRGYIPMSVRDMIDTKGVYVKTSFQLHGWSQKRRQCS
jgi:hypothetical protein